MYHSLFLGGIYSLNDGGNTNKCYYFVLKRNKGLWNSLSFTSEETNIE
jgi:hypothetical protein